MASAGGPDRKEKAVADGQARDGAARRSQKSDAAFRTISEVAAELDVPQHVLRFWETKFTQIRPMKRGGGRRYYRPEDVVLLTTLRDLLYREGYTIKGVQKLLRDNGVKALVNTVQERQERSEGGTVGPVGLALSESRDSAGAAAPETAPERLEVADSALPGADAAAPEAPAPDAAPAGPQGLDPVAREEIEAVVAELEALQGLLRQAVTAARPPSAPPDEA